MLDPFHMLPIESMEHAVDPTLNCVPFSEIEEHERQHGPTDRWYFEVVKTVRVNPGEDLEAAIRTHAKISLKPGGVYDLTTPIRILGACYVLGNCAIIRVKIQEGVLFTVTHSVTIPAIGFMERVCFSNVVFESSPECKDVCFLSYRNILFHGCIFSGAHMLALDMRAGAEIRGCQFLGNVCAVRSNGLYSIRVKDCTFEKCVFGIVADTKACISHCYFGDCTCSIKLGYHGRVSHCQVVVISRERAPMNIQLCTCDGSGGHVSALGNVHVSSHATASWPRFTHNVFNRVRIYLGRRRGIFHPRQCLFGLSVIAAPRGVAQRVYLYGVYDTTCGIMQLTRHDQESGERLCTCGSRHSTPCMRASYVTDNRVDRHVNSHDTAEFSSSDEDDY